MRARVTIDYEADWPTGLDRAMLHKREAERWMTSETVLQTAAAAILAALLPESPLA